ncbi:MAG: endonuclease/exonuclease/phosphatase family protein [Bacteroidota bacterium]
MRKLLTILLLFLVQIAFTQEKQYQVASIGFYNFENLFDTEDDPAIRDEEYTPEGSRTWDAAKYTEKLERLGEVVQKIGTDLNPDGLALLGVSEIENRKVLEDFAAHPSVAARDYQIVHYDSPDERGIDVALLYQSKYFQPISSRAIPVEIFINGVQNFTRDVLHVEGVLNGDTIHVFVNHWPSRRGGERRSAPYRNMAADTVKNVVDQLLAKNHDARIIIMGDLNDDPTSPSVKKHLAVKYEKRQLFESDLYNPMYAFHKKGIGTLAYRDVWNLFDQIILSESLVQPEGNTYRLYKAAIFSEPFMLQTKGRYKGYPKRTFAGGKYDGGYSDHFPVYMHLIKEVE